MINSKQKIASFLLLIACLASFGQQFNNYVVACGGKYEVNEPYQDKTTLGVYNPINNQYFVFDTLESQYVSTIETAGEELFTAVQDSIVKHNLIDYKREAAVFSPNVRSIQNRGSYVVVGYYAGAGSRLKVFDKATLTLQFEIPEITETVEGIAYKDDTLYVTHSTKSVVDQLPPFQVFEDSIGHISIVDFTNQSFVETIDLGVEAAGCSSIYTHGDKRVTYSKNTGVTTVYNKATGAISHSINNVDLVLSRQGANLTGIFNDSLKTWNFNSSSFSFIGSTIPVDYSKAVYDLDLNQIAYAITDSSTFGTLVIHDTAGTNLHSQSIDIFPNGLEINTKTGGYAPVALNTYFEVENNETVHSMDLSPYVFDANGDTLSYVILANPLNGVASISTNGFEIEYEPTIGFYGLDSIQIQVCDTGDCVTTWVRLKVTPISSVIENTLNDLSIFPNPAKNCIRITADWATHYDIKNTLGQVVLKGELSTHIDISSLETGNYVVSVYSAKKTMQKPIIITK